MSPLQLRRNAWLAEGRQLQTHLDRLPFRAALTALLQYHVLTEFSAWDPEDLRPMRRWRSDRRLSLIGYHIERRTKRLDIKERKPPPDGVVPVAGGCPLAVENQFWQQGGKQFVYHKVINGNRYNWEVQVQPFADRHFTVASAQQEPHGWRPDLDVLHRRILDAHAITAQLGCLVLYNGLNAGPSINDWYHLHALSEPEDGPLPIRQAVRLAGGARGPVLRLDEPYWPLLAFRITGSAETVAGEVCRLAAHGTDLAGSRATESIALYSDDGAVTCIYVPRDSHREYSNNFGGKLGAYEAATGSLVFSDSARGATLKEGWIGFGELWAMLREARPEWSDAI